MTEIDHVFIARDGWKIRTIVKLYKTYSLSKMVLETSLEPMHDQFKIKYNPQFPLNTPQEDILKQLDEFVKNLEICGTCWFQYDVLCNCKVYNCGRCKDRRFTGIMCECGWPIIIVDMVSKMQKKRKIEPLI